MSLRNRILVALVSLVTGAMAVVVLIHDSRERKMLLDLEEDRGEAIARSLAAATSTPLLTYNYVSLQQLAERAADEGGVEYVVILDKEGTVAGFSGQPQKQGEQLKDALSRNAFSSNEVLVQEVPGPRGDVPALDIAVPVFVEGSAVKWGMVRVGLSLAPVYAEVDRTRWWVVGSGFVVLILSSLVARLLSRRITGPLKRLVEATEELAKGNFDYRLGMGGGDEIGNLSRKFDDMSMIIREKRLEVERKNAELAALNAGLEEMVRERTRALAQAEEKYRLLVEESPNAICIIQDCNLKFFNQAFSTVFGYSEEELMEGERTFLDLLQEDQKDELKSVLTAPRNGEASGFYREIVGRHRNGSAVYLDMRSIWVFYEGAPALEAILVDVTEQKQMQERIVSHERLRALGEMASGVAHDFNNILGAILGRAQLLQRRDVSPEVARGLSIIEKAAQDGGASVRKIQEFSRVRTDREFTLVNLNAVLEDTVEMTRSRWEDGAHRAGSEIRVETRFQDVPPVQGALSELRELFINFILNAVDAITGKGTITLETRAEKDRVVITVADTGRGMSPEVQRRLFDPFFSTKGPQGTGLGMSIAYGTIRRHGGEIEVTTEEGAGTTFRIAFPSAAERTEPTSRATGRGDSKELVRGSGRILVVDDEQDLRELVAEVLQEGGYEVTIAGGGEEALAAAGKERFDLVVTDLGMPGMSGWDVAKGCREMQPHVFVILLTGWGAELDLARAEQNGIDRVLKKPFDMGDLLRAVREVRGAGSSRAA
jgi:PAS domain S-box-containing protein